MNLLFSPHNDDETLFAAYTIIRYRPRVVVCFSRVRRKRGSDYGDAVVRERESRLAMKILGARGFEQWDSERLEDVVDKMRRCREQLAPEQVWAPSRETSHPEHVAVAAAAELVFYDRLTTYHTYNEAGRVQTGGLRVPREPEWIHRKLRALAEYKTQACHPRACVFFEHDQREFYGLHQ